MIGTSMSLFILFLSLAFGVQTVQNNAVNIAENLKTQHEIKIEGDDIKADGKKLRIISGSFHYFRTPAAYWRDRLHKLKAAGLNTVSTYVEWSFHEPEYRKYNFNGDRDIAHFIRLAAEEGLHVLLRPGPYICAERDLGGLPYWLLSRYPSIRLRTTDKDFISETKIWFDKLFEHVTPLLFGNGGPIIFVQIENEYGSFGSDKTYMSELRDIVKTYVGPNDAILYTTDGPYGFRDGDINGTLTTIDFGADTNVDSAFQKLRKYMSKGPLMNSEYYPGWLTHWGEQFQKVQTEPIVKTMTNMLNYGAHFNFYMFYGGTNFEFTAGANYGSGYQPDITSYDYDAPLSEAGDPTDKYFAIREALAKYFPEINNITPPSPTQKGDYGTINVQPKLELLSDKGRDVLGKKYAGFNGKVVPTFESLQQRSGLMLYETVVNNEKGGIQLLRIASPRDRVYVYLNGAFHGIISRMHKLYDLPLCIGQNTTLSLLVENQGRINFGPLLQDYKGITSPVYINNNAIDGQWRIIGYPLEEVSNVTLNVREEIPQRVPIMYEGHFSLPAGEEPKDTFLDTTGWGKGYIWINGYNLGRYWPSEGPQVTLYVPGVWLRTAPAQNQILILELQAPSIDLNVKFINRPILDK